MLEREFRVEPLSDTHDRAAFSCGIEALDHYLRVLAGQDLRRGLSAVFVLLDVTKHQVAGFYTLSSTQVDAKSLPTDVVKRLPRRPAPATLLGRFAVDLRYRGMGIGGELLADALARAANASREVGAMAVEIGRA